MPSKTHPVDIGANGIGHWNTAVFLNYRIPFSSPEGFKTVSAYC